MKNKIKLDKKRKYIWLTYLIFGILGIILVFATAPSFIPGTNYYHGGSEDTLFSLNLSQNVTDIDGDPVYFYIDTEGGINSTNPLHNEFNLSDFNWISINQTTGIFIINSTNSNSTDGEDGNFSVSIKILDSGGSGLVELFYVNITPVNDAPIFMGLSNQSFNITELFEYNVSVTDEESNTPFVLNITFLNCTVAEWSTRNCSNSSGRELFNSSDYNFNSTSGILNISFTPDRNDVGSYILNFSVMDNSSLGNQTTSQVVNFTVLNTNSAPYFIYICDNERNATEDSEFTCWINVSDVDEVHNLTITANYTWFTFNDSGTNSVTKDIGILTDYNASAMINFTANDSIVGNWSINITLTDIGYGFYSPRPNSTTISFFINNTEDTVSLNSINNYTLYENTTLYVNAHDDDLLVPDKSVKNEILTFASNTSWVSISSYSSSGNYTTAKIVIDYSTASLLGDENYSIKVNVSDTGGNYAERNFTLEILGDTPAVWNETMGNTFTLYENNLTYFNFSENLTDGEGDSLIFSFVNDSAFPSFSINSTTGVINFTPVDGDVGYHNITINASDGKLNSLKSFNFTIYNVNDSVFLDPLSTSGVTNATVDVNSNINATEDNYTTIILWVSDDDIKIPSNQKSFYNESFRFNLTIEGNNSALFNFTKTSTFPTSIFPNRTSYVAIFTPNKSDVGSYNITINVSDANNFSSYTLSFNLTISEQQHSPVLMNLTNQTSTINNNFFYDLNATDAEDGSEASGNMIFNYSFLSGNDFINHNQSIFNITSGVLNITFNSTQGGRYHLNIIVNDSSNSLDSKDFWIYVYDVPNITSPSSNYAFNLIENASYNLTFQANHSAYDNLTYNIYISNSSGVNVLKYNLSYYGNGTNLTWQFSPNFTEETYGLKNLTLIVLNPSYPELNFSKIFNITINHTNAPVVFSGYIGDSQTDYNDVITINLSNYFSDEDYSDKYYNQTVNFSVSSNSTPSYITASVSNWSLTLSSSIAVRELLNITAIDTNGSNVTSNSFEVEFTTPTTTPTPTPSSGGGGATIPVAFKIITPGSLSAYSHDTIVIPIMLQNTGSKEFNDINLSVIGYKDGDLEKEVKLSLDKSYFKRLSKGATENISLTVFFDTNKTGDYEILINATSKSPKYTDWAKIYINIQEVNESEVRRMLIFTEEFIASNPECLEITELINEAKKYYDKEDFGNANLKLKEAIDACKEAISQPGLSSVKSKFPLTVNEYLLIATMSSMFLGISYYFLKRRRFRKLMITGE